MKKTFFSFLLSIILLCNFSINALASSDYAEQPMTGMQRMTLHGVMDILHIFQDLGVLFNPDSWASGSVYDCFIDWLSESVLIDSSETLEDYINAHVTVSQDENGEDIANYDSEIVNNIYNFSRELIEENSGFFVYKTADYYQILPYYADYFYTKQQYDALRNYIAGSDSSKVFILPNNGFSSVTKTINDEEVTLKNAYRFTEIDMSDKNIVYTKGTYSKYLNGLLYSTETWEDVSSEQKTMYINEDGTIIEDTSAGYNSFLCNTYGDAIKFSGPPYYYWAYETPPLDAVYAYTIQQYGLVSRTGISYRVYWSLDDMKQYSAGARPYYLTSDYYNYDSTVDNSTTITQTDIDNSITYGDIYNYIIYNYDNPDGLTEDELIAILEKYFGDSDDDNDDDDDDGDDDDDDDDDGGLLDFLDGIGSIGDAVLSILGKLLEYVGKALDLLSNTATKVIDLVPKNITNLLGGLFPFLPQEWLTAIELSLVLAVIIGIVGIFKK